ncbi:MAG: crotonase/enoyl-CoA hydratase family protein [Solirubrobacteraceae bacterium]|nr:crotonase/enoyl-CoA hydratase family protein [Solirubrobacteraceae bacterium]
MSNGVRYARIGSAAVLTIDRPDRRNAVDGPTSTALRDGYDRFVADVGARVLIVTGGGGTFCAGADLKSIETLAQRVTTEGGPLGFSRLQSPKPTIAAVEGWAVAGGLELAVWCDLRVAGESAKFGCTERRWGVPLIDGGTQRLPRIIGMGRAMDMILTGRIVESAEAMTMGLVTEVVPDGTALERALAMAEGLAQFPQETMLADRRAALEGYGQPLDTGLALEWRHGGAAMAVGVQGAQRFVAGEGRGGDGAGV